MISVGGYGLLRIHIILYIRARHAPKHISKGMKLFIKYLRPICTLFAILPLLMSSAPAAKAQCVRGQKSFGVDAGYVSRNKSVVAGIQFQYGFSSHFRVAPGARCIFRNNDRDAIQLDLDTHYPFNFTGNRAALYPIIGLNYSWWNSHNRTEDAPDEDVPTGNRAALYPLIGLNYSWWNSHNRTEHAPDEDVSTRKRNFGLNAGAGFEFTASPTLKIHIEARYSMVKSNSSAQLTAGIAYIF